MVKFRDYTSPSSKLTYLIIESEDETPLSKLLVHAPLGGRYSGPWQTLRNSLHMASWTSEHISQPNRSPKMWSLQAPNPYRKNIASTLPSLGRRLIQGEVFWGDSITIEGEFRHVPGYWEWAEDILSRNQQALITTKLYDAVYALLFTYDRNSNILQAFCEAWCPKTNTLLTSVGELSISLWDLYALGGLPIGGFIYEEVIPEVGELTGVDDKMQRFIPRSCEYLFAAFQQLQEGPRDNQRVPFSKWISFWFKKESRYGPAPLRKEQKTRRLKYTHNPTGIIPETTKWSSVEEAMFSKLGVKLERRDDIYLAAFLSCWLCAFVLPSKDGDFIRPETFKMASLMANGRKASLAVPALASIYHGLNDISRSSRLDHIKLCFPIHYVYGWLAYYFKTHFALGKEPSVPLMVVFSGEGGARYFSKKDARKHIHRGETVDWTSTMLISSEPYHYVDKEGAPEVESSFFTSIRFNYLPLRFGNSFIIEPYSPHRFSRQFGFYQTIPGALEKDFRVASLDEGLKYWRICMSHRTMSRATFPPSTTDVKKLSGVEYMAWWKKSHRTFFDDCLQVLMNVDEPIATTHAKDTPVEVSKGKLHLEGNNSPIPLNDLDEAGHFFDKCKSPNNSGSSDRCWKRKKIGSNKLETISNKRANIALGLFEVPDSACSPERTLTAPLKEPNGVDVLVAQQISDESTAGPDLKKSSTIKIEQEVTSIPYDGFRGKSTHVVNKQPTTSTSDFEGSQVVLNHQKEYILKLWSVIHGKLSNIDVELAYSDEKEFQMILEAMGQFVDVSRLKKQVKSLFDLVAACNREQLASLDQATKSAELLSEVGERLSLAMFEEEEKVEETSLIRQSLEKVKEKMKKLREEEKNLEVALEAAEKEIEDAKLKVSVAGEEYNTLNNTVNNSSSLEKKKQLLEASRHNLMDYKMY